MVKGISDFIQKTNATLKRAAEVARANDAFINNYRSVANDEQAPETTNFDMGPNGGMSNQITFRNANVGEKIGLQKISLIKSNGKKEDVFLIVPERESVGYGEIRDLKEAEELKNAEGKKKVNLAMPTTRDMWDNFNEEDRRTAGSSSHGENMYFKGWGALAATPVTAALDLVGGNTMMSNVYKNELSNYTGDDKAVGLGKSDQSEGQIFGMISSDGEIITPKETKYFLTNLKKNGYKGVAEIEQPEKVQEHNGPAYVPGDILLGLLGLQPNRGSVGYTFKSPGNFIANYRRQQNRGL